MDPKQEGEVTFLAHASPGSTAHLAGFFKQHFPLPQPPPFFFLFFFSGGRLRRTGARKADLLSTPHSAITSAPGSPPARFP